MKLVLIARHYPPAVSGGARRPYFLAHALRELGAEVFVVAPDRDPVLPGIAVDHPHRDPAPDCGTGRGPLSARLRNFAREWARWPDPDITWTRRAARAALTALPFEPDWIITTSPPESVHWAGRELKRKTGARWCADFRDQWFERAFRLGRRNRLRRWLETLYARHLLGTADLVVSVNALIDAEIGGLAGNPGPARAVLGHFRPDGDFSFRFDGKGPHLLHTGSFSLSDPDCPITPVLTAFAEAARGAPDLRLHLAGRLTAAEKQAVADSPAAAQIVLHGVVPLGTALGMQRAAHALIVAAAPAAPVPPGKYVEYIAAGRPVIAAGSGPWRTVIGLDHQSTVEAMRHAASLPVPEPGPAVPSAREAARHLLDAMDAAGRP